MPYVSSGEFEYSASSTSSSSPIPHVLICIFISSCGSIATAGLSPILGNISDTGPASGIPAFFRIPISSETSAAFSPFIDMFMLASDNFVLLVILLSLLEVMPAAAGFSGRGVGVGGGVDPPPAGGFSPPAGGFSPPDAPLDV